MESKTMKHISIFLLLLMPFLMTMPLQAQTINQKGVTYRYNGKNKRTPIGGVYIKAITANNGEVSDEQTGAFTLALNNLKMGYRIGNVKVTKQGMMVFNQQAVDEWSVRKDPLCLILCDADEFQKQKDNLIAIGRNEAKKKYEKKLSELKKQNEAQQLQIDDYYNKLDSLDKEYQNALKHMDEYADVFARIDESEVDTIAQRAIEMFNRGEIEESLHLLESQNYLDKIVQANRTIEQADELISTAEQAKTLAEQDKEKYIEGIKTQIAGYKLQNEWEKAKELLKGLADNLNTLDAIWDYAQFCQKQNDFKEAEIYYLKYEDLLRVTEGLEETEYLRLLTNLQNNRGLLYSDTQRYAESEALYKKALGIRERLAKANPDAFEPDVATTQNNLAILYKVTQRYAESESMYKSALAVYNRLSKSNPESFESFLATTQNNLATILFYTKRYSESEAMYKSVLEIRERLAKSNPDAFEPDLADTQHNLALLYSETQRYSESEAMYKSALEIYERLAKTNPSAFDPDLADTQNGLGNLYSYTKHYPECEAMHKSALEIRERLAKINPAAFEPSLAMTQHNLAALYYYTKRYAESEAMYKKALEIRERLAKANPEAFEHDLADTQCNLGNLYYDTQRYAESEAMYKSVLEIYIRLTKSNPAAFEPTLATIQNNLATLYRKTQRYSESELMYMSALEIQKRLAKTNPDAFEPDLAMTQSNLAVMYRAIKRYAESETMYKKALETYLHLYSKNPEIYEKNLMECYFWLGWVLSTLDKVKDAKDSYEQALNLARHSIKAGADTKVYILTLHFLSSISISEKDYVSAYTYSKELLPFMKTNYLSNPEKSKGDYYKALISISSHSNFLGKFSEGEQYSLEAIKVDSAKHIAYTNLAAALLFQGKTEEAEKLYRQYKAEFKQGFLDDFAEFERLGVIPEERKKDVERIKAMLNEE